MVSAKFHGRLSGVSYMRRGDAFSAGVSRRNRLPITSCVRSTLISPPPLRCFEDVNNFPPHGSSNHYRRIHSILHGIFSSLSLSCRACASFATQLSSMGVTSTRANAQLFKWLSQNAHVYRYEGAEWTDPAQAEGTRVRKRSRTE